MSRELAEFAILNCDTNIELALKLLSDPNISRSSAERVIKHNESFNALKAAVQSGIKKEN